MPSTDIHPMTPDQPGKISSVSELLASRDFHRPPPRTFLQQIFLLVGQREIASRCSQISLHSACGCALACPAQDRDVHRKHLAAQFLAIDLLELNEVFGCPLIELASR
jgi:hypothetical protein